MRRPLLILKVMISFLLLSISACRGGGAELKDLSLSKADNDTRVGREVIRCGLEEASQDVVDAIDAVVSSQRVLRGIGAASRAGTHEVPVFIHIIASGQSPAEGNISDAQVVRQLDVLNTAYGRAQSLFGAGYHFSIIGIARYIDPLSAAMTLGSATESNVKSVLRVGGPETLNLYISRPPNGILGWGTFPWDYQNNSALDGVVISYESIPGGSFPPYNEGNTLVHEVGHWLGLFHTFQGGCATDNDLISDTPSEAGPAFGCPEGRNSCITSAGVDPIHNFMDYSDDICLIEFSFEQAQRIVALGELYRGL